MERRKENFLKPQPIEEWPLRDALFRAVTRGIYGHHFDDKQIERLRLHKLGLSKLSIAEKVRIAVKFKFAGIDADWVSTGTAKLLESLDENEKEATQLITGLSYCGVPINRQDIADSMKTSLEELEMLITSSLQKIEHSLKSTSN